MTKKQEKIKEILMESIWITRWNSEQTSLTAVLTIKEARDICKDIIKNLKKAGYQIIKK